MGLFDRLTQAPRRAEVTWEPLDDRWYGDVSSWAGTFSGFGVSPDMATRVSAVFACVGLVAETLASAPCELYRRLEDDRREKARDHRLYRTVRVVANAAMRIGAKEFFAGGQVNLGLKGRALAQITGDSQRVDFTALDPSKTTIEQLPSGRRRFTYYREGRPVPLLQEDVLEVRDLSTDGYHVQARAALAREAIGIARAIEAFKGAFFRNDATGRLVLSVPGAMPSPEKRKEYREYIQENYAGATNRGRPMIVYAGAQATEIGGEHERGFMIDPANFQVADIARFWHVPPFLLGIPGPTAWGGGLEEQIQGFIDFGVAPWADRWVEALTLACLDPEEQEQYFIEFNFNTRVRANLLQRFQAYQIGKSVGMFSPNDLLRKENENPRTDPGGDSYQDNAPGAAPNRMEGTIPRPTAPEPDDDQDEEQALAIGPLITDAATRLAAAETRELEKRATKAKDDRGKWVAWLDKFYRDHRDYAIRVVTPLAEAQALPSWIAEAIGARIEQTGLLVLRDGIPDDWCAHRTTEIETIITETLRAGAAVRHAA